MDKLDVVCDCTNTYTCDAVTPVGMAHLRIKAAALPQIHAYSASMISTVILYIILNPKHNSHQ
jgi:hypothetical protein